jgi:excisionase family DNA binding protein
VEDIAFTPITAGPDALDNMDSDRRGTLNMATNITAIDRDTLTLDELAQRMGISLTVAYELAKADKLPVPVIRIGRQYRFSRRAYDELMSGQHADRAGGVA